MLGMLKRHEVEILLKVGHSKAEVARLAAAILDRVLERGRFIHLDGPSGRTRHLNLEETLPENTKRLRISGIGGPDFPEPTPSDVDRPRSRLARGSTEYPESGASFPALRSFCPCNATKSPK